MSDYKAVRSSWELSMSIADILEMSAPHTYNGRNRAQTVRALNDILQGRAEKSPDSLLAELKKADGSDGGKFNAICQDIQDFRAQKCLLTECYPKQSDDAYYFQMNDCDPEYPLKIINQSLYDRAAKDGFPLEFFRKSYFDHVTFYCLPDNADLNFSVFQDCTFSVCRIQGAAFDGTRIYGSEFHSCELRNTTFFHASIAHTHFKDSTLSLVSFQRASLKACNTIDCTMNRVNFQSTILDGCSYGRIQAEGIRNFHTATITQGGATGDECHRNRASIFQALQVPDALQPRRTVPSPRKEHTGPVR